MSKNSLLTKWRSLRSSIYEKQDLELFDEAEKCFKTTAYRMAYIAIWIAIAESLKFKFKKMAEKDSAVDTVLQEIERRENLHQPPDSYILEQAKALGILDDVPYQQLEPILKMRNIYGHPYNIAPSPEEVFLAAKHAVENVLSIPPLLRKPYIDNLLNKLQTDRHYIDDLEEKIVRFSSEIPNRIPSNLHPYLLSGLYYGLHQVIGEPDSDLFTRRLIWFTRTCIRVIKPDFTQTKWRLKDKFDDFPWTISRIFTAIDLWKVIPEDVQDGIVSFLLFPEDEQGVVIIPEALDVAKIYSLSENKCLTPRQQNRFDECLKNLDPKIKATAQIPLANYVDKIIEGLESHDWYVQNPAASLLWNLGPSAMKSVEEDKLENLGRNILQSAEGSATGSINFMVDTLQSDIKWPKSFVKGLLYECLFNEKNIFRCKSEHVVEAIIISIRNCDNNTTDLYDELLDKLEKAKGTESVRYIMEMNEMISGLDRVISELKTEEVSFKSRLNTLKQKLSELKEAERPNAS